MERRLAAILAADVVGFGRLMGEDEAGTLEQFKKLRAELIDPKIAAHHGRIFKLTGDGILAEFPSVVNAVACATEWQRAISAGDPIQFRIGVNLGDVMVEGDDIYGDGVNVAARIEGIAPPGGVAISQSVRDQVGNRLNVSFEDLGEQHLKNIASPIRIHAVVFDKPEPNERRAQRAHRPSVAVLPFNNMSGDPEQEYFSDGITEDIITDLSKISGLAVISRHTAFTFKGKPVKATEVSRELGADFILEGSVRKAGSRVRVTGQLINSADGTHLWAERFDRDLTDIFGIQDEITRAIVEQLKVKLLPQEKRSIERAPTDNVEAYTYYLRGRDYLHRRSKHYVRVARQMFAKAIELDPNYARAYAGLADCESFIYLNYRTDASIEGLLATTEKALSMDETLAEAHASRGMALSVFERYDEANQAFEKAIALDPNSFEAHYFYARSSFAQGKIDLAARLFERASEIRPDEYQSVCLRIHIYRSLGRIEESRDAARRGIRLAEAELMRHPDDPRPAHLGAGALFELGEMERAREWVARALAIDPDDSLTQYNVACGYTKLGEFDAAFDMLERAILAGGPELVGWVKHDSDLDALRSQPRYKQFLQKIGSD